MHSTPAGKSAPYVGPRPFTRADAGFFFGREEEQDELVSLIVAHPVVLLYAQSGAGKTSLINARVVPLLSERGSTVVGLKRDAKLDTSARVGGELPPGVTPNDVNNIYLFNALVSLEGDEPGGDGPAADAGAPAPADPKRLGRMSLAEYLSERAAREGDSGRSATRVVIFDQFEEIFTTHPGRWHEREQLFQQVGAALEEDSRLRVVFSMREEFLASMDAHADALPERLRTRFRLERLRAEAALRAVRLPAEESGKRFAPGVDEKLVKSLLQIKVKDGEGTRDVEGEYVEPVQLQVVCRNLWESLPAGVEVISEEHLKTYGDVDQALIRYYEDSLRRAASLRFGLPFLPRSYKEVRLRRWFEKELITPGGTRGLVYKGAETTGGMPNSVVEELESSHLVRAETRGGGHWYELTHDRFIQPILQSNQNRRDARERKMFVGMFLLTPLALLPLLIFLVYFADSRATGVEQLESVQNGRDAKELADRPGAEFDALSVGIRAVDVKRLREPPPEAVAGLRAAAAAVGSPHWLTGSGNFFDLSHDGQRALTWSGEVLFVFDLARREPISGKWSFGEGRWTAAQFASADGRIVFARSGPREKSAEPGGQSGSEQSQRSGPRTGGDESARPALHFFERGEQSYGALADLLSDFAASEGASVADMSVKFSRDGTRVLAHNPGKSARVFHVEARLLSVVAGGAAVAGDAAFSPRGDRVVFYTAREGVRIWDVDNSAFLGSPYRATTVWFYTSPDGNRLLVVDLADRADSLLFDLNTGRVLARIKTDTIANFLYVGFSADSKSVIVLAATTGRIGENTVADKYLTWDADTGEPRDSADVKIDYQTVDREASERSGRVVVVSATDKQSPDSSGQSRVSVLDAGRTRDLLPPLRGVVVDTLLTPDEGRMACRFADGVVKIWDLKSPPPDFEKMGLAELKQFACAQMRTQPSYPLVQGTCERWFGVPH